MGRNGFSRRNWEEIGRAIGRERKRFRLPISLISLSGNLIPCFGCVNPLLGSNGQEGQLRFKGK